MSKIGLSSNTSGTATFTIASPATNTNRILTLPDNTGTVLTDSGAITVNASAANASLVIGASGRVGIGTTTPSSKLEVQDTNSIVKSTGTAGFGAFLAVGSGTNNAYMFFYNATNAEQNRISSEDGGILTFNNGNAATERMRIDSSGNLMVGTTSPGNSRLSIANASSNTVNMSIINTNRTDQYLTLNMMGSNGFGVPGWADSGVIEAVAAGNATGTKGLYFSAYNGPMFFATSGRTERIRITTAGLIQVNGDAYAGGSQVTITKNSPTAYNNAHLELVSGAGDVVLAFHAAGSTAACLDHLRGTDFLRVVNAPRTAYAPIYASAFTLGSDYRLKENLTPLTDAAARLMQIPVHRFSFIENSMSYQNGQMVDGFLAHEVEDIVPEAVFGTKDAVDESGKAVYQGIDQSKLVPLLTAALQEALTKIEALEARINALESQ